MKVNLMMRTLGLCCAVLLWGASHVDASGQGAVRGNAKIGACSLLPPKADLKRMLHSKNIAYDDQKPDEDLLPSGGTECTYGDVTVGLDLFPRFRIEELRESGGPQKSAVSRAGGVAHPHHNAGGATRWAGRYIFSRPPR